MVAAAPPPLPSPPLLLHRLSLLSPFFLSHPSWQNKASYSISPTIALSCSSPVFKIKCSTKSRNEELENFPDDSDTDGDGIHSKPELHKNNSVVATALPSSQRTESSSSSTDYLSLGIREPVYEVVEVKPDGVVSTRKINRRQLLKSSGLRPRDIRSVDPSFWLTYSMPSLLVREHAILLNLGSLRAIAMQERVLIFDYQRKGGKAFIDSLLPRLNPINGNAGPTMPFELEVVEAALLSRIQRLEQRLVDLEPQVQALLEVLPNRLTGDILEQLRLSKQTLVELGSRAKALKQMLLDILEDPHEIRRICIMGRNCTLARGSNSMECSVPLEKQIAEEEEEEIEMLLENYLQRCESCHGQAEKLLDSAKEMEDSIAVNLSSRRLEVSRVELLLQVGAFCVAVGALVAGVNFVFHWSRCFDPLLFSFLLFFFWTTHYLVDHSKTDVLDHRYIWHESEILFRRTCVCILADNGWNSLRRWCGIFPYVFLFESEKNIVASSKRKGYRLFLYWH